MGEEVIMSARLWTSGYDIYGPTHNVVGVRIYSKFIFTDPIQNLLCFFYVLAYVCKKTHSQVLGNGA
jgi:hypothetical protein